MFTRSLTGRAPLIRYSVMTLYLLDASVLITAKNQYYQFGRVNQYWDWLVAQAEQDNVKIPYEIYEEITQGDDNLTVWVKQNKAALTLDEEVNIDLLHRVYNEGYAQGGRPLNDYETRSVAKDPFLIAYALADAGNRIVVTVEQGHERPSKKIRKNRRIPSVCDDLGVKCCNPWRFIEALDFRVG